MIVGLGLDVVAVARVSALHARHRERLLARCFAPGEVARPDDPQHLAGLLAAKEAAFKALGTGWSDGVGWRDARVARGGAGEPILELAGRAAERAGALGVGNCHLSITHAGGVAVAVVVLERA